VVVCAERYAGHVYASVGDISDSSLTNTFSGGIQVYYDAPADTRAVTIEPAPVF
jgi:hypothetical protein